jgi:hypothetical protein
MKHFYKKLTIPAVAIFIIAGAVITFTGCSKTDSKNEVKATSTQTTTFAYIPSSSNIIGKVNIAKIAKIESVKKQIEANKDIPYIKEMKSSGMDVNNISTINFGISPNALSKKANTKQSGAEGVVIIKTINKVVLSKFIGLIEKNHELTFKTEKIDNATLYTIPTKEHSGTDTFLTQLSGNLIAIGTKSMLEQSILLHNNKGKSVLQNVKLMQISENAKRNDMLWVAALIPPEASGLADKDAPKINNGLIYANYINNSLNIGGTINCDSNKDVQKILLPAQMIISLAAMNSNNTLKAEDISLKANKNQLLIDIKIPQAALDTFAKSAAANAANAAGELQHNNQKSATKQDLTAAKAIKTNSNTLKLHPDAAAKVKSTPALTEKTVNTK